MLRRSLLAVSPALVLVRPLQAQSRPTVVASFTILGDFVRHVAGDRVALRVIAGPDVDAHEFQPRPSDAEAMRSASLLVQNGLGFDPWFERLAKVAGAGVKRVVATEGITPLGMAAESHDHGPAERRRQHSVGARRVADPHAWQDVRLAMHYVRGITAGLAAALPAEAAAFQSAAAVYLARLEALDGWVRAQVATVPEARRKVITAHDAFGYFAAAYGIGFLAPQGLSTASEPSAAEVGRLIRQIRAEAITAVFVENMANPTTLTRLAQEAGVTIAGRLYADALSAEGGPAATYEAMVRHNVGLLVPAMRGRA